MLAPARPAVLLLAAGLCHGGPATAAEIVPGGGLDLTISGDITTLVAFGDLQEVEGDPDITNGPDLFNDTGIYVELSGESEGVSYGALVEFQSDTNETENTDETWIYVGSDPLGMLRFGDDGGVSASGAGIVNGGAVSAIDVARGTGGLDAYVAGDAVGYSSYEPLGTDTATKLSYATPIWSGLQAGVSYTPNLAVLGDGEGNGDSIAAKDVVADRVTEAILRYTGELAEEVGLVAAVSGFVGRIADEEEAGGDDYWAFQTGLSLDAYGIGLAGSYLRQEAGSVKMQAVTLGVGTTFGGDDEGVGGFGFSLNYGQYFGTDGIVFGEAELDQPRIVVLSADYGLAPGLTLQGDIAGFDLDRKNAGNDTGWAGVAALNLAF